MKVLTPIAVKDEILWLSRLSQANIRSNLVDINENSELREKQGIDQVTWVNTNTNFSAKSTMRIHNPDIYLQVLTGNPVAMTQGVWALRDGQRYLAIKKVNVVLEKATPEDVDAAALSYVLDEVALQQLRDVVNGDLLVTDVFSTAEEEIVCKESDTGDRRCAGFACSFNIQCFS